MRYVAGVFASRAAAECAVEALGLWGVPEQRLSFLTPDASLLTAVPTSDTEGFGSARAMGAVVGGALGVGGGFGFGVLAGRTLFPATDLANAGITTAILLGLAGVLGGFALGQALEELVSDGLPKDELLVYEDAVRQGRSVVIAAAKDAAEADEIGLLLDDNHAESVDIARKTWSVGLRGPAYPGGAWRLDVEDRGRHGEFEIALELLKNERSEPPKRKHSA